MSLFAIKNDEGKYWDDVVETWTDSVSDAWELEDAAKEVAGQCNHVVELAEKPTPIVVSEAEAEMLQRAKDTANWRPAAVIEEYAYDHKQPEDDVALLEDHLMRAYVNGWVVEKPKLWNIKVKYAQDSYYYKTHVLGKPIVRAFQIAGGNKLDDRAAFTLAEIEHYGLQDCEKVEVHDGKA